MMGSQHHRPSVVDGAFPLVYLSDLIQFDLTCVIEKSV